MSAPYVRSGRRRAPEPPVDPGPARGGARLTVVNPATGEVVRTVAEDAAEAIARKYERARKAQKGWAATPLGERKVMLARFGQLTQDRTEELARTLTTETGKPIAQARNELKGLQARLDFFLANADRALAEEVVHEGGSMRERIVQEPLGVVGNVSAWNYPYFVGSNVFVPALLTGNAVLYKPSEFATLTGIHVTELLHEAGVPPDVFQSVIGAAGAGTALLEQPLDGIFFTGSYATGTRIAEAAARRLMRVQLELGGKDPAYVADDVDVEKAAHATADGAFYNNGQSCCAVERLYVHERVHDAFLEAFVAAVKGFTIGDPMDEKTYIGPVTREAQLAVLTSQVQDAVQRGARLLTGGKRIERPGFYFEPTVLSAVTHEMSVMKDETFGPVIGIQEVKDDDEALSLMNDTEYGLTAAVYAKDRDRAQRILERVHAGTAYWNCCDRVSPRLPWSGRRHSGVGSTLGLAGIRAFVQPKAWHMKKP
ncbi:MAG TPA: aldehyde dehydrogenase family protein [Vicinamibacteria bacterium]|nr:aldehyde dehydrogenase family protein [Vicinamibacteria bacterium]